MKRMKYMALLAVYCVFAMNVAASEAENSEMNLAAAETENSETVWDSATAEAAENFEASEDWAKEAADTAAGQVAQAGEMTTIEEVVQDWMVPIYPDELNDGTYEIEVDSSSSMFSVDECVLTVADGQMTARMTMGGKGYLKVYMGTGAEAVQASEEEYISFEEAEDGRHIYEVPVEALDCGIACTAFSKNREKWYDRTLVFKAATLPLSAYKNPDLTTLEDLDLEDGTYTVEVSLQGGAGKTQVESPAELYVEGGLVMAEIVFGSSNYDYVIVDGEKCSLLNEEGNSAFLIPVAGFDYDLPITADSIALGKPREIDYKIRFDSPTIEQADD